MTTLTTSEILLAKIEGAAEILLAVMANKEADASTKIVLAELEALTKAYKAEMFKAIGAVEAATPYDDPDYDEYIDKEAERARGYGPDDLMSAESYEAADWIH